MSFLSSKYGDIRVTSKDTRFRSIAEARDSLINKCDGQSVLLHSIAVRIFSGEILTISEVKGILRFPSSASDEEVINSITDDLLRVLGEEIENLRVKEEDPKSNTL
ncbi:hypothetical protein GEMRC1_002507 [Eukaryota sp. GEM-RC1]